MPDKPNRLPDFVLDSWYFYFREMLQWNSSSDKTFYVECRKDNLYFYDDKWDTWKRYDDYQIGEENDAKMVYDAYVNWHLENTLLG